MGSLAETYRLHKRHAEALVLEEQVVEIRRRVLPEDHPDIGEFAEL